MDRPGRPVLFGGEGEQVVGETLAELAEREIGQLGFEVIEPGAQLPDRRPAERGVGLGGVSLF